MLRLAANLSLLFTEMPFLERFAAAAAAGFDAVEIHYPYEFTAADLRERLDRHALRLVLINSPRGDASAGEHGLACRRENRARFVESIDAAAAYAAALDCPLVHVLTGLVSPPMNARDAYRCAVDRLGEAAEGLASRGLTATVEALNAIDVPGYLLDTPTRAIELIRDVGAPNLGLQWDVYHARLAGGNLLAEIDEWREQIAHVQVADAPGRHEPGTGAIDFQALLGRVDESGYAGWIGCEYRPLAGTVEGLHWARPWLRRRVDSEADGPAATDPDRRSG